SPIDYASSCIFSSLLPPLPISPLFPYTTLFRSHRARPPRAADQARPPGDRRGAVAGDPDRTGQDREDAHLPGRPVAVARPAGVRSEEHTSELQSRENLVCRLLLEKKKKIRDQAN